jgi:hypothetical protein
MIDFAPPAVEEYGAPYAGYVSRVPEGQPIMAVLERQLDEVPARLASVPESRGSFRYAPGKWSVKELVTHLSDTERVMAYRALRIGRGDPTPLPGFDENLYAPESGADGHRLADLVSEWADVRRASLALFRHFPEGAWTRRGHASGMPVSVRALAYIIAGHTVHHFEVLAQRYGLWPSAARSDTR